MENLNLGEFLLISNFMIHNFLQFPQQNLPFLLEVCVPELVLNETRRDETRLELISRIGGIRTRLMFSGLVTRENLGKIWEINGTRRDYSLPFGKVSSSTGFWDFSQKTSKNNKFWYQFRSVTKTVYKNNNFHSGSVREFPTQNETWRQPVPNDRTESEPGKGCSRMLRTLNFPGFFGKNPVPGKRHSGMQTSTFNFYNTNCNSNSSLHNITCKSFPLDLVLWRLLLA